MKYVIDLILLQHDEARDVVFDEPEVFVAGEMSNVCQIPSDEIVDSDDAVAFRQKSVHQMRAEKTRTAGDDGNGMGTRRHMWLYLAIDPKIASTKQTFVIPSGVEESLDSILRSIRKYKMRFFRLRSG